MLLLKLRRGLPPPVELPVLPLVAELISMTPDVMIAVPLLGSGLNEELAGIGPPLPVPKVVKALVAEDVTSVMVVADSIVVALGAVIGVPPPKPPLAAPLLAQLVPVDVVDSVENQLVVLK